MYIERTPNLVEPASSGIGSLLEIRAASTQSDGFPAIFCHDAILLASAAYPFSGCQDDRLQCAERKNSVRTKKKNHHRETLGFALLRYPKDADFVEQASAI